MAEKNNGIEYVFRQKNSASIEEKWKSYSAIERKNLRLSYGLRREELAVLFNVESPTVARWEETDNVHRLIDIAYHNLDKHPEDFLDKKHCDLRNSPCRPSVALSEENVPAFALSIRPYPNREPRTWTQSALRDFRTDLNITHMKDWATLLGVSPATVSQWESKKSDKLPTKGATKRWLDILWAFGLTPVVYSSLDNTVKIHNSVMATKDYGSQAILLDKDGNLLRNLHLHYKEYGYFKIENNPSDPKCEVSKYFGLSIKKLRLSLGLSQAEFAKLFDVQKISVTLWEATQEDDKNTRLKGPTLRLLQLLSLFGTAPYFEAEKLILEENKRRPIPAGLIY